MPTTVDWTTTIGASGDRLVFALADEDGFVDVTSMTNVGGSGAPQLRIRRQNDDTVLTFDVLEFVDDVNDPPLWNAQVSFGDFADITPGVWYAQVVGEVDGELYYFPRDEYRRLKFIAGINV